MTERPTVFIDTETTGLHAGRKAWEIAAIRRHPTGREDTTVILVADVDLRDADPRALEIGHFAERHVRPSGEDFASKDAPLWEMEHSAARYLMHLLRDATLVGAQPSFDADTLRMLLDRHGFNPSWHYRLRDVESMTAGYLGRDVGGLAGCMEALGLEFDPLVQHTALGDADAAKRIYDKIMGTGPVGSSVAGTAGPGPAAP